MTTGALIVAAGLSSRMKQFKPLLPLGESTIVQCVIQTFQQADLSPIVLVTGYQADRLENHVKDYPITCLRNELYETTQMLESIQIGLRYMVPYMDGLCTKTLITPVDIPLFTLETVQKLMECNVPVAIPTYENRKGHPLLISREMMQYAMQYDGPGGLSGAIREKGNPIQYIEVNDGGILLDADTPEDYQTLLEAYERNRSL